MSATTKPAADELEASLACFTGTEEWHRHWTGRITYTDGVKFLAEKAGAFWLIDLVASHQTAKLRQKDFQVWTLTVDRERTPVAIATCRADTDEPCLVRQEIDHTDFPLSSVTLWLVDRVLMLPNEY